MTIQKQKKLRYCLPIWVSAINELRVASFVKSITPSVDWWSKNLMQDPTFQLKHGISLFFLIYILKSTHGGATTCRFYEPLDLN